MLNNVRRPAEHKFERRLSRNLSSMSSSVPSFLQGDHRRLPIYVALVFGVILVVYFAYPRAQHSLTEFATVPGASDAHKVPAYNFLEKPLSLYNIAIITDMDKGAKQGDAWVSRLLHGKLFRLTTASGKVQYEVKWDTEPTMLKSYYSAKGRGMELSELTMFYDHLYTVDDKTGILYKIVGNDMVPVTILADGDGETTQGFKGEWITVKDDTLYVGSWGMEWTDNSGRILSHNPQWIKTLDSSGRLQHANWRDLYQSLRKMTNTTNPGYLIHEAVNFNHADRRWYFLPRRFSLEQYNDVLDEQRGTNLLISLNENFEDPIIKRVGPLLPSHGFSSFKFVPGTLDEIVAIKSEENGDLIRSYITVFNTNGDILMAETPIEDFKYEGIEFLLRD